MSDLIKTRKGIFIPDITVEMFRNASLEAVEELLVSGEMQDIILPSAEQLPIKRKCTVCPHCSNCDVNDDGTVKTVEQERLTDDDFETIRIHLNAQKENLCNQQRWEEAEEYQRIIDRFMAFAFAQPDSQPTCNNLQQLATTCNQLATDTISRQMAIDAVEFGITYAKAIDVNTGESKELFKEGNDALKKAVERLKELPSAEPEIIRCRDCKHWDTTWQNDFAPNYHYCPLVDGTRRDDFYCADAERRGEQE